MITRYSHPIRLPLQTGASVSSTLFLTALGILLFAAGLGAEVFMCSSMSSRQEAFGTGVLLIFVVLFFPMFTLAGVLLLRFGWSLTRKRRASDIIFATDGLTVEGGPLNHRAWKWAEMDASRSKLMVNTEESVQEGEAEPVYAQNLIIENELVATSSVVQEQESFAVVLDAIWSGLEKAPASNLDSPVDLLTCPGCGVPLAPVDADCMTCPFCNAQVAVNPALREKARGSLELERNVAATAELLPRLLQQPSARRTNALVTVAVSTTAVVIPCAIALSATLQRLGPLLLGLTLAMLFVTLARASVRGRRALHAILTGFSARAPDADSNARRCRCCGAPLPSPVQELAVAVCVYCRSANVLGIDLQLTAAHAATSLDDLQSMVAITREERGTQNVVLVLSALLGIAAVVTIMLGG